MIYKSYFEENGYSYDQYGWYKDVDIDGISLYIELKNDWNLYTILCESLARTGNISFSYDFVPAEFLQANLKEIEAALLHCMILFRQKIESV